MKKIGLYLVVGLAGCSQAPSSDASGDVAAAEIVQKEANASSSGTMPDPMTPPPGSKIDPDLRDPFQKPGPPAPKPKEPAPKTPDLEPDPCEACGPK